MPISPELQEIYATAVDQPFVETLSFTHSRFTKDWHITNDMKSWTMKDENGADVTYEQLPFAVKLPTRDGQGTQELQIAIANAGLDMMKEIELAQEKPDEVIQCSYRVYLAVDGSSPEIDPPLRLSISEVTADLETINCTASRFDLMNRAFPRNIYTTEDFPGLRR